METATPHSVHSSHACPSEAVERLELPAELRIVTVGAIREELLAALLRAGELTVNLGRVTSCDTAGLQVLVAARKSAERMGKTMRCVAIPAVVSQFAEDLGISFEGDAHGA